MEIAETAVHTCSIDQDNRLMWLEVSGAQDLGIGIKINIGNIKAAWINPEDLKIYVSESLRVFTITNLVCLDGGNTAIEVYPAIILDGKYINCSSIACKGDKVTKL